jgi:hypothetical protein
MLINTILAVINLIAGILSLKFIGLECVLTIQLIYFSQLLINPWQNFPAGFMFLKDLKYINGYNNIFKLSEYFPLTLIERKYFYFSTKKLSI